MPDRAADTGTDVRWPDESFCRLLTPRLEIRRFRLDDARLFAAYRSDPEVARYQGWEVPYPLAAAERFITALEQSHPRTPGEWFQFALARRDDGELVGDCAARPGADDPRIVEIGFSMACGHQGRGYGTEPSGDCSTTCSTTTRLTPRTG